jgi:hypothetical protein
VKTPTTRILLFALLFSALLFSCDEKKNNGTNPKDSLISNDSLGDRNSEDTAVLKNNQPAIKFDKKYDQIARAISGIRQETGSPLASTDTTSSWKSFSTSFDSSWALIQGKRFSKMVDWRNSELADVNATTNDVFYPFSGPDILNAFILFPKAKTYTLLALEPIGELPDFEKMSEKQKQEYYISVELSLNDLLKKSYFITRNMLRDLQKHRVNGTLPLMCLFLKRTGNTIVNIKNIGIDTAGKIFERADSMKFKGTKGVRIDFLAKGSNELRSVYYFKCDLEDAAIKANKGLSNYLQNLGTVHTYLKSASYILHYKEFTTVRDAIFSKSDFIVQDDSGIAFHFFDQTKWKITLYGKYVKPVHDFPHIKEPDLQAAYQKDTTIKPLPFELGYHWGTRANNMLKAAKIK